MGNAVACAGPQNQRTKIRKNEKPPPKKLVEINDTAQPQAQKLPTPKVTLSTKTVENYNCSVHPDEPIKAVCMAEPCDHPQKLLCCECLIDHCCQKKLRTHDFIRYLRSRLSKDAQELFQELFDDKNQVRQDLSRQVQVVSEMVVSKVSQIAQRSIPTLITNYYWASLKLPLKLNAAVVHQLQVILDNRVPEASQECLDFALYLMANRGMLEQVCEEIERKKNSIHLFASDFQQKFTIIVGKYIDSLKVSLSHISQFLFHLLITPMEYIVEEDAKPQQTNKRTLQGKDASGKQAPQKPEDPKPQPAAPTVNTKCLNHQQEVLAICTKLECNHKDRKMCADCLIDTKCNERMKINEFSSRLNRMLNREYIEQMAIPWDDLIVHKSIGKLFTDAVDQIKQVLVEMSTDIVREMFVKFHLIEETLPKELKGQINKDYFDSFMAILSSQKLSSSNKAISLAIKFINSQDVMDNILGAIVKTEQILPKKADKLQHKLLGLTLLFLDKIQHLLDLYKQHTEPDALNKQFQFMNTEAYSIEENIYKLKTDGKGLSEWEPYLQIKPSLKIITDVCFVNQSLVAIAYVDGNIIIFNLNTQKQVFQLKHGNIVTALRAFQFNSQPILVSSGYSTNGHTICTWDLKSTKPNFSVLNAHKDSIRKLKYLHVNPAIAQTFYSNNNSTTAQLSSQISQTGSQNSIYLEIDEQLISCSDDGQIKIWKLDTTMKLVEEQVLKSGKPVLDFTLLNGCILVSATSDKTLSLSLPFQSPNPFQVITDDCPIHSVSPVDQLQPKKKHTSQQKFITGNEKGVAKIYQWQNGRAVIMKVMELHSDTITKISMLQPGFIASVSQDKTICLTLVQQAKVLLKLEKHAQGIMGFAYQRANGQLITADQGGNIIIWK